MMPTIRRSLLITFTCLAFLAPAPAGSPQRDAPETNRAASTKFLRIRSANDAPVALETAVVRYRPRSGEGDLTVDLIAVVHIGERSYYQKLNRQFQEYDALLYELVASEGARPAKKNRSDNPLGLLQKITSLFLDLHLQVDEIDYNPKNFVHADLSPEGMAAAIKKRGDDGLTLALGITADLLRQQNLLQHKGAKPGGADNLPDFWSLLDDPAAPAKLKRLLARQFEHMDDPSGPLGRTLGTILIDDRNQAAMKVLGKEIAKGKKKLGIFYGAAHMPDFNKRLRDEFDLVPVSTRWLPAWNLELRQRSLEDLLFRLLEESLK
jgi:hypothetical protein